LSFISKRIQQQPQLPPTAGDKSGASVPGGNAGETDRSIAKREREKKKDETIFGYLKGLVD
jgi:hypothetical protein